MDFNNNGLDDLLEFEMPLSIKNWATVLIKKWASCDKKILSH